MTGEQKPGGLAQKIYDCPTTFDGDAIGTHLGLSMMVDQSTSNAEEQRRVVVSMCEDIARMIQAEPAEARIRELAGAMTVQADQWAYRLAAMSDRATAAEAKLANLLARIHRDGGHRQQEVGTEKACEEAEAIIARALQQEGE